MRRSELFSAVGYKPHVGQIRFHESDARFKVLIAGARFGKSLAASKDVLAELLSGEVRGWLVGPTYALAVPEYRYLREDALNRLGIELIDEKRGGRDGSSTFTTEWGAEISCLSAQRPEGLLGEEIDWLILCEAAHLDRDAFERYLRARLATREGRLVVPSTPRGRNWLLELYERGIGDTAHDWESFRHATWDNPLISAAEIESARDSLPPETFDEQYGGAFSSPSGRVYPEFDRGVHEAELTPPPAGAVVYKAMDFGFTNPFVCLWGYLDGDGRLIIFDEYSRAGATLDVHAAEIKSRDDALRSKNALRGPAFADPSGRLEREQLAAAGVPTVAATNDLLAGIDIVRQRLVRRPDDRPGLLVDRRCIMLVREFETYCWDERAGKVERVPIKCDDHALDALRYLSVGVSRQVGWDKRVSNW